MVSAGNRTDLVSDMAVWFQLAAGLEPVEVRPGAAICMLTASLVAKDNKSVLKVSVNHTVLGR